MKKTGRILKQVLLFSAAAVLLSGCGEDRRKYDQAGKDLEQGSYEYALAEYLECVEQGLLPARSLRGAGLSCLRLGRYQEAADYFSRALGTEKLEKALRKDLLEYRATAYLRNGNYDQAMADCQVLVAENGKDPQVLFLAGSVALAMDSYQEASADFTEAYKNDSSYDMALLIYEEYMSRGMEADGIGYLETANSGEPKTADDYCDQGRIHYYMGDYSAAASSLSTAMNKGSTEAILLLGMVYTAQNNIANARIMYEQYLNKGAGDAKAYNGLALCDIAEGSYDAALEHIAAGIKTSNTTEMQNLLFNEIVVYEKRLDFATAKQKAEEYCIMFPDDQAAQEELAFLKTRVDES